MSDEKFQYLSQHIENFRLVALRLKHIKAEEINLRTEICDVLLKGKTKGTHSFNIDGMDVKAVRKINMSLDKKQVKENLETMSDEEKAAISWKPELSITMYNKIKGDSSDLDRCLTIKPATPTLTVVLGE